MKMQNALTAAALQLLCSGLFAQAPEAFNYQGVARDAGGDALANTSVGVQFQLHQGTAVGTVVYSETHSPTTNELGLFSVAIGNGTPGTGTFAAIDWSAGPYFLEVGLDPAGGSSYTGVGTQQLLSVPYALHAKTADMADDGDWVLSGDTVHNNGRRVGIGTSAPSRDLDVEGSFQLKDGTQGDKKILTSDADGNASWQELSPEVLFGAGNVPGGDLTCLDVAATIATGQNPYSVAVSGDHAYVVGSLNGGMMVFDISTPASPSLIATIAAGSLPLSVAVSGEHAYVVDASNSNLMVYDVSTPASPSLSATIATGSGAGFVAVSDDHAYVVNYFSSNMMVFDISTPASPSLSATIATGNGPYSVSVSGDHAFVVNSNSDNMTVYDVTTPASPNLSATIATGDNPRSVAVSGDHAFVVNRSSNNMMVFDISTPASPSLSATIATGASPSSVSISGGYAFAVNEDNDNMMVFDISTPTSPSLSATIATGASPSSIVVSDSHAYVVNASSDNMMVFELFCPAQQQVTYDPATGEFSSADQLWQLDGDTISSSTSHRIQANTGAFNLWGAGPLGAGSRLIFGDDYFSSTGIVNTFIGEAGWQNELDTDELQLHGKIGVALTYGAGTAGDPIKPGLRLFNDGTVAVGQDTPIDYKFTSKSDGVGLAHVSGDGTIHLGTYADNAFGAFFQTHTNHPLHFTTNNGDAQMTLLQSGNLGIGTDAPVAKLHSSINAAPGSSIQQRTGVFIDNSNTSGVLLDPSEVALAFGENGVAKQAIVGATYGNDHLRFYTGSNFTTPRMAINAAGNVGIGTGSPVNRLDVEGGLAVGASYSGISTAPANGAIVQGNVGIGTDSPVNRLDVEGGLAIGASYSGTSAAPANGAIVQGSVGIGTTAPEYTLHISNGANTGSGSFGRGLKITDATPRIYFEESDAAVNQKVMFLEKIDDGISFSSVIDNATLFLQQHILFVKGSGSVGIGTSAPTAKLSVNGNANNSTGSWGVFSDARIKTVQREFTDGLSVIDRLRPVVFTYNSDAPFDAEGEQVGIIAQELEELAPYMVSTTEHGDIEDLREVNNQAYVFLLINAVKELSAKVDELQAENVGLRNSDADLRAQLKENSQLLAAVQRLLDAQTSR